MTTEWNFDTLTLDDGTTIQSMDHREAWWLTISLTTSPTGERCLAVDFVNDFENGVYIPAGTLKGQDAREWLARNTIGRKRDRRLTSECREHWNLDIRTQGGAA